jgi:DNA-binding transcriptional MerR regulator
MEMGGAYTAERAAALSGVPRSPIYYWARQGLVPSLSRSPLLWSYTDLLALRTLYWLRQPKRAHDREVPATSMPKVRRALAELRKLDLDLFEDARPGIGVTLDLR